MFLGKGILKICNKFTEKHPCRSATLIKLQSSFIETALQHGCFPVNLMHIFRTPFPKNTSGGLLLDFSFEVLTEDTVANAIKNLPTGYCCMTAQN